MENGKISDINIETTLDFILVSKGLELKHQQFLLDKMQEKNVSLDDIERDLGKNKDRFDTLLEVYENSSDYMKRRYRNDFGYAFAQRKNYQEKMDFLSDLPENILEILMKFHEGHNEFTLSSLSKIRGIGKGKIKIIQEYYKSKDLNLR